VKRELSEDEIAWKLEGTQTYQELTVRSLASLHEVAPLAQVEADRPRLPATEVRSLIATKQG
jgi:phenylacetic acid degradation protein